MEKSIPYCTAQKCESVKVRVVGRPKDSLWPGPAAHPARRLQPKVTTGNRPPPHQEKTMPSLANTEKKLDTRKAL